MSTQLSSSDDLRKCPFCAELIKKKAVFCKYCRSQLPSEQQELKDSIHQFEESSIARSSSKSLDSANTPKLLKQPAQIRPFKKIPVFIGLGLMILLVLSSAIWLNSKHGEPQAHIIIGSFNDRKALELLYGKYHPELKGFLWTDMKPPHKLSNYFNQFVDDQQTTGKGITTLLLSQEYIEGSNAKHILITSTLPTDGVTPPSDFDSYHCHASAPLLSAAIFVKEGNGWRIESEFPYLDIIGGYGKAPGITWKQIGKDRYAAIVVLEADSHTGLDVMQFVDGKWKSILSASNIRWCYQSDLSIPDTNIDMNITFDQSGGDYYDAVVTTNFKMENGTKTTTKVNYHFVDGKYVAGRDTLVAQMLQAEKTGNDASLNEAKAHLDALVKPSSGDRNEASCLNKKGIENLNAKKYDDAIKFFGSAYYYDPAEPEFVNNLGWAELLSGDFDSAKEDLCTALSLAPSRVVAWGNLGYLYKRLGDEDQARASFLISDKFSGKSRS